MIPVAYIIFKLSKAKTKSAMYKSINLLVALLVLCISSDAQKLQELLKQSEANYPLLKAKRHEVQAGIDRVAFAQSSALPSLDAAYQLNYATYNNITGMAVAQSFVPISGPPSTDNSATPVFGSAAGLLLSWEPFTFGQRKSRIESAKAAADYHHADANHELFQHKVRTINAYLELMLTHELIKVFNKNLERSMDNVRIVRSLTKSGLRPGTDSTLFIAELSRARIELYTVEKLKGVQEVALSELLGGSGSYSVDSVFFTMLPVLKEDTAFTPHPLIRLSASRIMIGQREKTELQRTLNPKLSVWGTAYARGSGIRYDGFVNPQDGLSFSRYNYGAGLVLSVPLLRFTGLRHQVNAQESGIRSEEEKLNLTKLQLAKQEEAADLALHNALKIAEESPSFYRSAELSCRSLKSRYRAGLVNYADYIQAQYALIKSEADLRRNYVEVWKALLYRAAVQGDLTIFLNELN